MEEFVDASPAPEPEPCDLFVEDDDEITISHIRLAGGALDGLWGLAFDVDGPAGTPLGVSMSREKAGKLAGTIRRMLKSTPEQDNPK